MSLNAAFIDPGDGFTTYNFDTFLKANEGDTELQVVTKQLEQLPQCYYTFALDFKDKSYNEGNYFVDTWLEDEYETNWLGLKTDGENLTDFKTVRVGETFDIYYFSNKSRGYSDKVQVNIDNNKKDGVLTPEVKDRYKIY